jgi:hypothetical protein
VVLRKLEGLLENLDEDVDVVSVHSPKYDGEASSDALEAALQRIEVKAQIEYQKDTYRGGRDRGRGVTLSGKRQAWRGEADA